MKMISASLVKELRELTGVGIMECKEALVESEGDLQLAIELLRKSSGDKAIKKAERTAAEGIIAVFSNGLTACMVEVNCETDFVAKDESFIEYAEEVVNKLSNNTNVSLEKLMEGDLEEKRERLIQNLGENIKVRRIAKSDETADTVGLYLHTNKKIASIVSLVGGDEITAKDIAMHISATDPIAVSSEDISKPIIEKEREIFQSQQADTGKSPDIIEKIVDGKIHKFLSEVSLIEQDFVKDPEIKVKLLLKQNNAEVISFKRFRVGEGIEIERKDFAAEVISQIEEV